MATERTVIVTATECQLDEQRKTLEGHQSDVEDRVKPIQFLSFLSFHAVC